MEIAQRYDLDRVYNGEISGWQSLEETERSEHRSLVVRVAGWAVKDNRVAGEVALPWLSHHRTYGSRIAAVPQEEELA